MAEFASKKLDKFFRSNYHSRKEIITSVKPGEEETADYLTASNMITTFMDTSHSEYLYTIRPSASGGLEYAVDGQYEDASKIGDEFVDDEAMPVLS